MKILYYCPASSAVRFLDTDTLEYCVGHCTKESDPQAIANWALDHGQCTEVTPDFIKQFQNQNDSRGGFRKWTWS